MTRKEAEDMLRATLASRDQIEPAERSPPALPPTVHVHIRHLVIQVVRPPEPPRDGP